MHGLPMTVDFTAQGSLLRIETKTMEFKFGIDSEFERKPILLEKYLTVKRQSFGTFPNSQESYPDRSRFRGKMPIKFELSDMVGADLLVQYG